MTFLVDNSLTIEVFDRIKANGGKITVYKDLDLRNKPALSNTLPEKLDCNAEPEYELLSKAFPGKEWEEGWNYAESTEFQDPIPLIVCSGHTAGPGMFHAWLQPPKHTRCIPFEGRLEDFHFAGRASKGNYAQILGIRDTTETHVHLGFKRLYLYKIDRELGIKMLLERRKDERMTATEVQALFQSIGAMGTRQFQEAQQAQTNQLNSAMQAACGLSQQMIGQPGAIIEVPFGGIGSGNGKPAAFGIDFAHQDSGGPSKAERFRGAFKRLGRVLAKARRTPEPDNS
jgi:hypothetical protein